MSFENNLLKIPLARAEGQARKALSPPSLGKEHRQDEKKESPKQSHCENWAEPENWQRIGSRKSSFWEKEKSFGDCETQPLPARSSSNTEKNSCSCWRLDERFFEGGPSPMEQERKQKERFPSTQSFKKHGRPRQVSWKLSTIVMNLVEKFDHDKFASFGRVYVGL